MASSPFEYRRLIEPDSFRIVLLHPSSIRDKPLQCTLLNTTLSTCDRDIIDHYTALSYVWGNAAQRGSILIDNSPMDITATLESAFRHIRDATRVVRIWADALCINQKDNDEKAIQVELMDKIYGTAQHTIIYLGSSFPEGDVVLSIAPSNTTGSVSNQYSWLQAEEAGDEILKLPWFSRVWVFQELVLSSDPWVQVGHLRARWTDVCSILLNPSAGTLQGDSAARRKVLKDMDSTRAYKSQKIFDLLLSRRGLGATNASDMIFAHMSTASDLQELEKYVKVDYGKSCEVIYENVARYLLDHVEPYGPETFFRHIDDMDLDARRQGLASWAPDWSIRGHGLEPMFRDNNTSSYRQLKAKEHYVWTADPWILAYIGYEVEVVKDVSLTLPHPSQLSPKSRTTYQSTVGQLQKLYRDGGGVWWSGDAKGRHRHITLKGREVNHEQLSLRIAEEWIKIMAEDVPKLSLSPQATEIQSHETFLTQFSTWLHHRATQGLIMVGSDSDGLESLMYRYLLPSPICNVLTKRKLIATKSGRIGVAPKTTRPGDVIIYLAATAATAMVMRRTSKKRAPSLDMEIHEAFAKQGKDLEDMGIKCTYSRDMAVQHGILIGEGYVEGVVGWLLEPEEEPQLKIFALR
jgi:hypothetical protein